MEGYVSKIKKICKLHLNRSGFIICEILHSISLASKKRRAHVMVQKIKKKKKKLEETLDEVVVETNFESGSDHSPI